MNKKLFEKMLTQRNSNDIMNVVTQYDKIKREGNYEREKRIC